MGNRSCYEICIRHSMMEKEETAKREAAEKLGNVLFSGK